MQVADILGALKRVKNSWPLAAAGCKVTAATREILRLDAMAAPVTRCAAFGEAGLGGLKP
jgi:hypothetical protein